MGPSVQGLYHVLQTWPKYGGTTQKWFISSQCISFWLLYLIYKNCFSFHEISSLDFTIQNFIQIFNNFRSDLCTWLFCWSYGKLGSDNLQGIANDLQERLHNHVHKTANHWHSGSWVTSHGKFSVTDKTKVFWWYHWWNANLLLFWMYLVDSNLNR